MKNTSQCSSLRIALKCKRKANDLLLLLLLLLLRKSIVEHFRASREREEKCGIDFFCCFLAQRVSPLLLFVSIALREYGVCVRPMCCCCPRVHGVDDVVTAVGIGPLVASHTLTDSAHRCEFALHRLVSP